MNAFRNVSASSSVVDEPVQIPGAVTKVPGSPLSMLFAVQLELTPCLKVAKKSNQHLESAVTPHRYGPLALRCLEAV